MRRARLASAMHRCEQYLTFFQVLAHALRHTIGRLQCSQGFCGSSDFFKSSILQMLSASTGELQQTGPVMVWCRTTLNNTLVFIYFPFTKVSLNAAKPFVNQAI